jgi:NRPS condensation-like uncharacterized protein
MPCRAPGELGDLAIPLPAAARPGHCTTMLPAELTDAALFASMPRYGDLRMNAVIDARRSFSRAELERAVEATIRDFPVLGCRYDPRFWRDRWVEHPAPASELVHVVDARENLEAETLAWIERPIDPTRERPLRIVSLERDRGSRVIVSVMHLAVDGAGMAAVGHVLGSHLYGILPALPVDPRRDLAHSLERLRWYHLPALARDAVGTLLQPGRTRAAAERERDYPSGAIGARSWRHLVVSAAELGRIKARCRAEGASINDALLAALARVAAARSSHGPVAVTYTMDLRRYGAAPRLTAANTSSILTIIVPRERIGDLASTAGAVSKLTARQQRGLVGPAFALTPASLAWGAPHALLRRFAPLLHPVAVDLPLSRGLFVTNVGRLDEGLSAFGEDIEQLRVVGPNVNDIPVPGIVALGFRGQLQLELLAPPGMPEAALAELDAELSDALELDRDRQQ